MAGHRRLGLLGHGDTVKHQLPGAFQALHNFVNVLGYIAPVLFSKGGRFLCFHAGQEIFRRNSQKIGNTLYGLHRWGRFPLSPLGYGGI